MEQSSGSKWESCCTGWQIDPVYVGYMSAELSAMHLREPNCTHGVAQPADI